MNNLLIVIVVVLTASTSVPASQRLPISELGPTVVKTTGIKPFYFGLEEVRNPDSFPVGGCSLDRTTDVGTNLIVLDRPPRGYTNPESQMGNDNGLSAGGSGQGLVEFSQKGIVIGSVSWLLWNEISYSIKNETPNPIKNVTYLIIFRDKNREAVDTVRKRFDDVIEGGLAVRQSQVVDTSVWEMNKNDGGTVEFRVLGFDVVK